MSVPLPQGREVNPHHYYHTQGLTDLGKLREEAQVHAGTGERVILHLHEYEDEHDGCSDELSYEVLLHEIYEEETA